MKEACILCTLFHWKLVHCYRDLYSINLFHLTPISDEQFPCALGVIHPLGEALWTVCVGLLRCLNLRRMSATAGNFRWKSGMMPSYQPASKLTLMFWKPLLHIHIQVLIFVHWDDDTKVLKTMLHVQFHVLIPPTYPISWENRTISDVPIPFWWEWCRWGLSTESQAGRRELGAALPAKAAWLEVQLS